jgi:hypothetical protein
MVLIRAGLHVEVNHHGAYGSIFGSVVAGLERDFLDCVCAGLGARAVGRQDVLGRVLALDAYRFGSAETVEDDAIVGDVVTQPWKRLQHIKWIAKSGDAGIGRADPH